MSLMIAWYYLVIVAAVFYTIATLIEKGTLAVEHASAYSASACLIAALFSLLLLPYANFNIGIYAFVLILVAASVNVAVYLLTARVYKHSNVTVSSPVLSSLPQLFVVVLAFFFLGEQLDLVKYVSIAVMLIAVYFMMFRTSSKHKRPFERNIYIYFLLGTAILAAVFNILLKFVLTNVSPVTYLILLQCFMAIEMMAYMQLHYGGVKEVMRNTRKFSVPIVAAAAFTTAYRFFYYSAVSNTFVALASPLLNTFTAILVVLMGALIFKEGNMKKKLLLSGIMMVAVYFLVFF
jgi:drug/metabolite transporter (DMT)-like permease